jgi:hypothetical protein
VIIVLRMLMRINVVVVVDFGHVYYLILSVVFLPKKLES